MQFISKFKILNLGFTAYYLHIEVFWRYKTIKITQIIYINQFLNIYKMSNYNLLFTPMIENTYLIPTFKNFLLNTKNILVYKQFIKNIK